MIIQPDPSKVQAAREFLDLVGYYHQFIPGFATIAALLTNLTRKGQPNQVNWGDNQEVSFQQLKYIVTGASVLQVADPSKPYTLQMDASNRGFGAVLSQHDPLGDEHPAAFASRKLLPRETKYSTIEKECLAIIWALQFFHVYLYGQSFTVQTDYQPLAWLQRTKNTNPRLTRWAIVVQPLWFLNCSSEWFLVKFCISSAVI